MKVKKSFLICSTFFFFAGRAFDMMKNRGQRSWSVGLSIADITNSILTDKMKTHSVSTLAQVCLILIY